jgi:hypothetical protein
MSKYQYEDAVKQLQETGSIGLVDLKSLSHDDLVELCEEIKVWCLYANGKLDKLPKESKKKKKEAVDVDVDLEFHTPDSSKPRPIRPSSPATSPSIPQTNSAPAEIRKIDEARASIQPIKRPPSQPLPATAPKVSGTSAMKEEASFDFESNQVVELREHMRKIELESQVKVAVAEFKTEYLSEMLSDIKLMEHQIGQLLLRINAKHPEMKNEVLMIKKILADFTAKKRR